MKKLWCRLFLCLLSILNFNPTYSKQWLTDKVFGRTNPVVTKQIYQILSMVNAIFTKHKITYWMIGGTMLGAIRHRGIIPWDDDADLAIAPHITKKHIFGLKKEFARYHLRIYESIPNLIKVVPQNAQFPFVDLFMTTHDQDKKLVHLSNTCFPDTWFDSEIYPLQQMRFGPLQLPATMQYMRYLFAKYGNDCMTHATYRVHLPRRKKNQYRHQKVKIVNFKPAPWR